MKKRIRIFSLITALIILALTIVSAVAFIPKREKEKETEADSPQTEISVGSISPVVREENTDVVQDSAEIELDINKIPRDTDSKLKGSGIQYGKKEIDNK